MDGSLLKQLRCFIFTRYSRVKSMFYSNIEFIGFPNWSIYSKLSKDANLLFYSMWVECTGHSWFEYFYTGKCLSKKYRVNTISYTNMMSKFTQSVNLLKVRTKQFPQYSKLVSKLTTILFRWVNSVSELRKALLTNSRTNSTDQRSARNCLCDRRTESRESQ